MAACSAACSAPGNWASMSPAPVSEPVVHHEPDSLGEKVPGAELQRFLTEDFVRNQGLALEGDHLCCHFHITEVHGDITPLRRPLRLQNLDLGHVPGGGVVVGVGPAHHHAMVVLVQVLHHVALALVDIDGAGVGLVVRLGRVHGAQQGAGVGIHDAHRAAAVGPQVHHGRGALGWVQNQPAGRLRR